ncbi:MAG: MATE family efflux transporter [Oscillospiraceae bacterium]|nr:MATE family efflux transporter [Oscillospiraceae bacterium]
MNVTDGFAEDFSGDFSKGSVPAAILRQAFPLIGAQIVNVLYNIVDRIFIGRIPIVGRDALTGLGVCFPIITLITAFANLAGNGGAPRAAIARGAGDTEAAGRFMGNALSLLLIFSVACVAVFFAAKRSLLGAFGASGVTLPYADEYMSVYLFGTPAMMISLGMNPFINMQGYAKIGMLTVAIGAVVNLILDPLFIFVFGMGVRGAALASVIAQYVSALWAILFLTGKRAPIRVRWASLRPRGYIIRKILSLGFSNFTMSVTESAVQTVCNTTLSLFGGDLYVGVMTVVNSVRQIIMLPMSGFAQGASPVVGFNYGAKRYGRVREAVRFQFFICVGYALAAWLICMALPGALIRVFNRDAELIAAGIPSLRIYFSMFFAMSMQMTGQFSFVAMGKAKQATFFSFLRKGAIVIPLALILPRLWNLGVRGVFIAEPISDIIGSTACFTTFMLTQWRRLGDAPAAAGSRDTIRTTACGAEHRVNGIHTDGKGER